MIEWLLLPLSGNPVHHVAPVVAWHARLMVLAWGVLLPLGVLVARYYKVTPGQDWPRELDNKLWWHAHRVLQYAGVGLALAAVALLVLRGGDSAGSSSHRVLGWSVLALAVFQVVLGALRGSKGGPTSQTMRGDHYDMTPQRRRFELLHKSLGWLAVALAVPTLVLGLREADSPRWMPLVLAAWWTLLALAAWRLQRAGRCVDTYQAIWGPDPAHPGNRVEPTGWGVCRPAAPERDFDRR
jgi:Eukaryotic cytochrome b561